MWLQWTICFPQALREKKMQTIQVTGKIIENEKGLKENTSTKWKYKREKGGKKRE